MAQNDDRALLRIAEAITDGTPVDWNAALVGHRGLEPSLKRLRLIESVATAHRTPPRLGEAALADNRAGIESTSTLDLPADAAGRPLPLSTWGPLKILELLGQGGFGEVYRAFDPSLQREVALKLRRADRPGGGPAADRFIEEARRLARLRHPNVVVVHGVDRHEGRAGLWIDLLRGKTLEQILVEQGPLGAREAALIGIDLCSALAAVHAAGLVHRDVKTSNIMREQGGRIVLMDFGSVTEQPAAEETAGGGAVSGTPLFMAPEVCRGETARPSSDIYGVGVTLYRLVSGRFPVEAASLPELLEKHRRHESMPLRDVRPDLPAAFVQVVGRALAPEMGKRYPTAGAMEQALAVSIGAGAPEAPEIPEQKRLPTRRVVWISLAAAAALAIVSGVVLLKNAPRRPFTVEATLYRRGEGTEERLLAGARVHPGNNLFLEIQGQEKMYVYVLNEDERGDAFVLFPVGLDLDNPLPPHVRHRLPGSQAGRQMTWEVTSAGNKENFLVIASRQPLEDLERDIAHMPRVEQGRQVAYAPISPQSLERLRGIGGLAEAPPAPGSDTGHRLSGIARSLSAVAEKSSDIWVWQIELENPGL